MSVQTKPSMEVYCPDCGVCCVPDEKESKYSKPNRQWTFRMTCWKCGKELPTIMIKPLGI